MARPNKRVRQDSPPPSSPAGSSAGPADKPSAEEALKEKIRKFNEQYETATTSPEQVLSTYQFLPARYGILIIHVQRTR